MIKVGDKVKWKWGGGYASGVVKNMFDEKTTRKIAGKKITINGSKENRACYIERKNGNNVLQPENRLEKK